MKKVILIPDSFKGTMSSAEICSIMEGRVRTYYPNAEILSIPVADGGEGSVDCFLKAMGGEKITTTVKGPYFEDMEGFYGLLPDGTAVVEMAASAGLPLVGERRAAEKTTTYGVGQLMAHALQNGAKKLIVGLGGSATNDGGAGAAAALGVRFFDDAGETFVPVGETLPKICHIDISARLPELAGAEIVTMCDIDNPLCGKNGAAYVFGPQKGASQEMVEYLDNALAHLDEVITKDLGSSVKNLPGAGAAGGMGGGMVAFFGSRLQMGIDTVLDVVKFDQLLEGAQFIITGEGKIDSQSLQGKVVVGIARRARFSGVPVIAVVGDIGDHIEPVYEEGVCGIFSINRVAVPFEQAKLRCKEDLHLTMDNIFRFVKTITQGC